MQSNKPNTNAEGYADPTAYEALSSITEREKRIGAMIKGFKLILAAMDCSLYERVIVKDKTTGRVYR